MSQTGRDKPQETDPEVALAAMAKMQLGKPLTQKESAALRRVEQTQIPHYTKRILTELPKKEYLRISGRRWPDLKNQAERHGIPCTGPTVNVEHVILWLHDFFASRGRPPKISDPDLDDPLLSSGGTSDALEKCRIEKFKLLRMERLQKERQLLSAEQVQQCFTAFASILRKAGERLNDISPESADVLYEAIDDGERLVGEMNAEFEASGGVGKLIDDAVDEPESKKETPPVKRKRRTPKKK